MTIYRIHPAIGIARVGNSPGGFFIGPEQPGEFPDPDGGFKDGELRVKRQAARFRIFAHEDDRSYREITAAEAEITWTVHPVNRKAAVLAGDPGLAIDPGPTPVSGTGGVAPLLGVITFPRQEPVPVPLGEIRTDEAGRLIVLGGAGAAGNPDGLGQLGDVHNAGWYDDTSDGPVTAAITVRADGSAPPVEGAWVVVGPPKFAPHQDSVITLYDALLDHLYDPFRISPPGTSYRHDIHPILQRARDSRWVFAIRDDAHDWTFPVREPEKVKAIFQHLRTSGIRYPEGLERLADMPLLGDSPPLTRLQSWHLLNWLAGTDRPDWSDLRPPTGEVTPDGLDRAALEAAVGAALSPGIEVSSAIFRAAFDGMFRLDHTQVAPGTLTADLSVPWQDDFKLCYDGWWPVPRPDTVEVAGSTAGPQAWARDLPDAQAMVDRWYTGGFVVRVGAQHLEVGHSDPTAGPGTITLETGRLDFPDIAQRPMGTARETARPIELTVDPPDRAGTFEFDRATRLDPQLTLLTRSAVADPVTGRVQLWVGYRTGAAPSAIDTQTVTVRETTTGQTWAVTVDANTVARRPQAVALVLERSAGTTVGAPGGIPTADLQRLAAHNLIGVLLDGDSVAVLGYDDTAGVLLDMLPVSTPDDDGNRQRAHDAVDGMTTGGDRTSMTAGLRAAREVLTAATDFDDADKSIVIVTDTAPEGPELGAGLAYIAAVGEAPDLAVPWLTELAQRLLLWSDPGRLPVDLLHLLADIDDAQTITSAGRNLPDDGAWMDPVPFEVTEADTVLEVIVLTEDPGAVDLRLQAPSGLQVEPWLPAGQYGAAGNAAFFRFPLPVRPRGRAERSGAWQLLVRRGEPRTSRNPGDPLGLDRASLRGRRPADDRGRAQSCDVLIRAYSDLALIGFTEQDDYTVGGSVLVSGAVTQSEVPVDDVTVTAQVTTPTGDDLQVDLAWAPENSRYEGSFVTTEAGIHPVRLTAAGRSRAGWSFARERVMTASARATEPVPAPAGNEFLRFLACLLDSGAITDELKARIRDLGLDLDRARECLDR